MAAACCNEDTDVLWELLEMGADTTVVDPQGLTALGHASLAGRLDSVELLLAYGANIKRNHAENALHQALSPHFNGDERQRAKMLHLLLRNGAKLDAVGKFGRTPFMEAVHDYECQGAKNGRNLLSSRHHLFLMQKSCQTSHRATFNSIGNHR